MWQSLSYRNAVELQRSIMAAQARAEPKDLAQLGRAFCALELLKLRLRMKPAPKPIDTTKLPARNGSQSHGRSEPAFAEQ